MVRDVYGHPRPLWEQGLRLDACGVNAVFVPAGGIDSALLARARAEGCQEAMEEALATDPSTIGMLAERMAEQRLSNRTALDTRFAGDDGAGPAEAASGFLATIARFFGLGDRSARHTPRSGSDDQLSEAGRSVPGSRQPAGPRDDASSPV